MSNDLEFRISARDQASNAIDAVKRKIMDFGKDIGKGLVAFAGPMALMNTAIGFVTEKIAEYKAKVEEAVGFANSLSQKAGDLGVTEDEFLRLSNAASATGVSLDKLAKSYKDLKDQLSQARGGGTELGNMLESLGFAAEDIAAGLVEPIEVIRRLGEAMTGAGDDTQAMAIATAVLGRDLAEKLLPALKEARDLSGEFNQTPGLSKEEADFLRAAELDKQKEANREKLALARRQSITKLLGGIETDTEVAQAAKSAGLDVKSNFKGGSTFGAWGLSGAVNQVMRDPALIEQFSNIIKKRAEAERERLRLANEAKAQAVLEARAREDARIAAEKADKDAAKAKEKADADAAKAKQKADADAAKAKAEADKADREKVKQTLDAIDEDKKNKEKARESAQKITLSSLREIGGALSGEMLTPPSVDYPKETLEIEKRILVELERLNGKIPGTSTDFTKQNSNLA